MNYINFKQLFFFFPGIKEMLQKYQHRKETKTKMVIKLNQLTQKMIISTFYCPKG